MHFPRTKWIINFIGLYIKHKKYESFCKNLLVISNSNVQPLTGFTVRHLLSSPQITSSMGYGSIGLDNITTSFIILTPLLFAYLPQAYLCRTIDYFFINI